MERYGEWENLKKGTRREKSKGDFNWNMKYRLRVEIKSIRIGLEGFP